MTRRAVLVLSLLLAGLLVAPADVLAQKQQKAEAPPPTRYPRVELEHFLSNPAKYHDHRMTVRGDVSKAGSYYAFTNPKNARDRRYAKLELTDEQREWVRKNCQSGCVVDVKAKAKQGPPFGRLKVRKIEKAPPE